MSGFGDGDPELDLGKPRPDRLQSVCESGVENHHLSVGVVEQVDQFLAAIPVVGVDWSDARLEGCKVDLQVLRTVKEVGGDLGLGAHAPRNQMSSQRVGPCVELSPGDDPPSLDQGWTVGGLPGDGLPDVSYPPVGHVVLPKGV